MTVPKCNHCYKDGHGPTVWMFQLGIIDLGVPTEVWLCPVCDLAKP